MSYFNTVGIISDGNPYDTHTSQLHDLGQVMVLGDGRIYRFAKAGGSNISAGKLQLAPSPKTNHHDIAVKTAASVGDKELEVTLGATAATENEYAEGFVVVNDANGEGTQYRIVSHPAGDSAGDLVLTLADQLAEALTTSSEVTLVHNSYNGVQESTTQTLDMAGVPLVDIAAGEYGWLQTRGVCPVLADETLTVGAYVSIGSSTAGAVEEADDVTAPITEPFVGRAIVAGVDTEYRPIFLEID